MYSAHKLGSGNDRNFNVAISAIGLATDTLQAQEYVTRPMGTYDSSFLCVPAYRSVARYRFIPMIRSLIVGFVTGARCRS